MQITRGCNFPGTETVKVRKVGTCWLVLPFPASRATDLNVKNGSRFQHGIYSRRTSPSSGASSVGHACVITRVIAKHQCH